MTAANWVIVRYFVVEDGDAHAEFPLEHSRMREQYSLIVLEHFRKWCKKEDASKVYVPLKNVVSTYSSQHL